jgi:phosphatidylserine/phosphatidylglycerophosphate/cardiolipin synthase-like enzyme
MLRTFHRKDSNKFHIFCSPCKWIACCLLLLSISCSYIKPNLQNLNSTSVEDLHVEEEILYPDSPFDVLVQKSFTRQQHFINILDLGDDALLSRIHLIRQAKKAIYIQTFIWKGDESSWFLAYELIQAAKRGVKVKVLVDYIVVPKEPAQIAFMSTVHPNLEIKLYSPVSNKIRHSKLALLKKAGFEFKNLNRRMHNKIFIVDDRMAITGGRNYANDYFDRGEGRNFKDLDVLVIGSVVKEMTDSFTEYWFHPLSVSTKDMRDVQQIIDKGTYPKYKGKASFKLGDLFDEIEKCEADYSCIEDKFIKKSYVVNKVDFFADKPGKGERLGKYKVSRSTYELFNLINQAQRSIVMQTPYLVVGRKKTKFFKKLAREKPDLEIFVSSNSLASADHVHAYAFSYKNKKKYLKKFRWQIFELKPVPEDTDKMISPVAKNHRRDDFNVCIHSKAYVIDQEKVLVGSFNLDPRSANLNTEVGLIIYDNNVALAVEESIRRDMANQNSWTIGKRKKVPVTSWFSGIIDDIMKIIPIIDVWPFTYSGSFELKPEKPPVPFYHKDFYDHYNYAGPFPGAKLTRRKIKTRLIKGFLGPIQPLI